MEKRKRWKRCYSYLYVVDTYIWSSGSNLLHNRRHGSATYRMASAGRGCHSCACNSNGIFYTWKIYRTCMCTDCNCPYADPASQRNLQNNTWGRTLHLKIKRINKNTLYIQRIRKKRGKYGKNYCNCKSKGWGR